MTARELYEERINPLSSQDKLTIARLIIDDVAANTERNASASDEAYNRLKSILPNIERISLTDTELSSVRLDVS